MITKEELESEERWADRYFSAWQAAQHRMHWTALWVGLGSFVLGFATCAIILYWL